ncbi:hypothetical protein HLB42_19270 (plasmid) [Deinococcus sp. D7000]|uniref:Uncharacterized protein n=1 Tax=Deinococcus radiopugnans ATCC 19172 TaxID=585398 RepID=A0A5C4YAZ1_9DEIO|nr:hypothetical protein [Deinococcus radiopugnans]MBB6015177.1 hypothetical protein [Deinococcus radiopugnans ATCC 19172]QLG13067.1 hypothetical protein HLB42_19270 [Deinococcus sp. D7000]TNM73115.1 hypothetical protein FHR04_01430 [Deinococcus radiopugnans ATCC 19172]
MTARADQVAGPAKPPTVTPLAAWNRRSAASLLPGVLLEASVVPHAQYGEALTAADLLLLGQLRAAISAPLILPTQKRVTASDLPVLQRLGVDALMYGVIVTGDAAEGFERVARTFRSALGGQRSRDVPR